MAATAWPFGDIKASLPRISFRWPRGMDARDAERQKAEIERAFRSVDDALIQLDRRLSSLDAAVKPAYGEMTNGSGITAGANITAAWQNVVGFTVAASSVGGVIFDPINDRFMVSSPGIYLFHFSSFMEHNSSAAIRIMSFRLDVLPATSIDFGTAKNVDSSTISIDRVLMVDVAHTGIWNKLQVSSSATISSVQWHDMALEMTRLGDL